jgi:hypothetical protein
MNLEAPTSEGLKFSDNTERVFWQRVYLAVLGRQMLHETAVLFADRAVEGLSARTRWSNEESLDEEGYRQVNLLTGEVISEEG